MPNTRGATTRERVIEEAAALIREKGFRATSIGDVLERAGVQKGSFYYYFPSKEDLGHAVLSRWTEELRARLLDFLRDRSGGIAPLDRVAAALDGFVQEQESTGCRGGCPFGNLAIELADVDEGFREPLSAAFRELSDAFAGLLRDAREDGTLRPDADPRRLGAFLVAAIEGGILLAKVHRDCEPLRASLSEAEAHVASFRART
jgi:TetR/AcrR family transcriptional repressor of nem operon